MTHLAAFEDLPLVVEMEVDVGRAFRVFLTERGRAFAPVAAQFFTQEGATVSVQVQ